jgi:hypothetical protein
VEERMSDGKIARMPMAEVVEGPWRGLELRKRRAIIDSLWRAEEDPDERYELIQRILKSMDHSNLFTFAELALSVGEEKYGYRPTMWRRIEASEVRRRV